MNQLIIAEKPSVAQVIAAVLGAKNKKDGYLEGADCIVSWCIGHLIELAPPQTYNERYAKWRREDLPILPDPWQTLVSASTKKQFAILKGLMNRTDMETVVCATDAGREGELIFRLVYEKAGCHKPVKRLWISSLEESAIRAGFAKMKNGREYDCLYRAALCRAQADWLVGINATRLFSLIYGTTLNVGRVMSPTLALVVEREQAIAAFRSEPFFVVQLSVGFPAQSTRYQDRQQAESLCAACHGQSVVVKKIEKKEKTEKPPKLYDLTSLQRDANRIYGYTAQQTLDYTQSLYEKKLVTYPRTDSRYLTSDMADNLPMLAQRVASVLPFAAGLNLPIHAGQVIDDSKVTDHHAIIPTQALTQAILDTLPMGERDILNLIAVRLLCTLGDMYRFEETTTTLECESYEFTARGQHVIEMGWQTFEATFRGSLGGRVRETGEKEYPIPPLLEGQRIGPAVASLKEGRTSPPKHYTEDTLLAAMECAGADDIPQDAERKGLGTPATRAGILEKLVKTGFIERKGDKRIKVLMPTSKGRALITVLPEQLKSPLLTAQWEQRLRRIEQELEKSEDFMRDIRQFVSEMTRDTEHTDHAEQLFLPLRETSGACPKCGAALSDGAKASNMVVCG